MTLSAPVTSGDAQGMTIVARTQGQLVRRRFFQHKAAMTGLVVLLAVVVLAFTSVGFGPFGGWWKHGWTTTGRVIDGGAPTLTLWPFSIGEHPFGQDNVGKDYFALVMRGTQQSLLVALLVGLVATSVGTFVGAAAGYFRRRTETALMRLTDVMITIPVLLIAAIVGRMAGGSGILVLGLALGLVIWPQLARLVRGEVLSLREREFIEAARAIGTRPRRIIFKHILPNTLGIIIVSTTLTIASAILVESAISFLGFGVQPPDISLGQLISFYQGAMLTRPWLFWWPGILIITVALSINFIGDGLRDAFDPRQNRVRA
ncbi:ABC transporter permease [Nonomuraea soli]|uniref:Peptide/nickel transport system permease protein n=1 Tax=Nonomuraea soli TaxID=1032476 RepID=A0A7W0HP55_9ACTN|nr:ABC transporter permease [Nonomuraea soli]MBA2890515.1 peptide/nickel transport system permease protein [Nonomuraea soli]